MKAKLEKGFFGFFVKQSKVSILITILIILYGAFSLWQIPKESSPDIKFGIIGVTTIYTGVNPNDIDNLVTEKIEKEIKDIEGIKKISSTSSLGVSSITIELETGVETKDLLVDIKDKVEKVSLPSDAEDPVVTEMSTDSSLLFGVYLYARESEIPLETLYSKALDLQNYLEGRGGITEANISPDVDYEVLVSVNKTKLENLGLSLGNISSIIGQYNQNTPIGNYQVGDLNYDFRFDGELSKIEELLDIPIIASSGRVIKLGDISEIKRDYVSKDIHSEVGFYQKSGYNYVSLTINKSPNASVFATAKTAKELISNKLSTPEYKNIGYKYVTDLSEIIVNDYKTLAQSGISTLLLVMLLLYIFLGLKEGIIATILIPLAFLVTFITLNLMGFTLNFLTNFSLLLTLGIALDTIIVVVEGASEKMKVGYSPKNAVLITVKEFKAPLISGTSTTLAVFLPMMMLPGVLGKFLAYIPITVFITLLAGLVLSLTINSALFTKLNRNKKYYIHSESTEMMLTQEEKELLDEERDGKIKINQKDSGFRDKLFNSLDTFYYNILVKNIQKFSFRFLVVGIPFLLLILSFMFLSPRIGFTLFPSGDSPSLSVSIEGQEGSTSDKLIKYTPLINDVLTKIPEIKIFSLLINGNTINVTVELYEKDYRDENGMRNSFLVEDEINEGLSEIKKHGLKLETQVAEGGPPTGSPVGIKLIAQTNKSFDTLISVSKDFEDFLSGVEGTKNVGTTTSSTPGQFVFKLNNQKLANLGLTPNSVLNEIYFMSSGIKAGTIKGIYDDHDIYVKISDFENDELSPEDIMNMEIPTSVGKLKIKNVADYEFSPAIASISREDGNVVISVNSDLEDGFLPNQIQPKLIEFAQNYKFPADITYSSGGEASENAELISSTLSSFFIALFLIFGILVFQFNSYSQPAIVLYSVVLALVGVNIGLYITGNPYSMTFGIGFIALTGIVVNNAIILIDKINSNIERGVDKVEAVAESGRSRLRPILLTTLTTIFGILPLALQDPFWAGLGYTIIFGLSFATILTLFVTPSLYYQVFLTEKKDGIIKRLFKKVFRKKRVGT